MRPYRFVVKMIATLALLGQVLYYSSTQPGPMDTLNGAIMGLVIYAFWLMREDK